MIRPRHALPAAVLLCAASPAHADLPPDIVTMLETAIAAGDRDTVEAVVNTARTAFPADSQQIDTIWRGFLDAETRRAAQAAARQELALRQAGLFDNWSGQGQIGGFQASGNSDEFGVTAALTLEREGLDWEHKLRFNGDYRRQNGRTSREQLLARYEPRYQINDSLFAYGLAQFERNVIQGFDERYAVSGGLGYRLVDTDDLELSLRAGPAYRVTNFTDGTRTDRLAALLGLDFDWAITESIKLTQDANATAETGGEVIVLVDGASTSFTATTGLEAGLLDSLSARLSWTVDYDSNPPAGAVETDTLTRFTLIYGF